MNFAKVSILVVMFASAYLSTAHADQVTSLPTIKVMADAELRDEAVGVTPFQEDKDVRLALQHKMIKNENEIQNYVIGENLGVIDVQPRTNMPDMSKVSPFLQEYVLAVAKGLQSSDPTTGLFKMLEPVGVDRNAALEGVRNGSIKLNIDNNLIKILEGNMLK